jgi:hypothetical protein
MNKHRVPFLKVPYIYMVSIQDSAKHRSLIRIKFAFLVQALYRTGWNVRSPDFIIRISFGICPRKRRFEFIFLARGGSGGSRWWGRTSVCFLKGGSDGMLRREIREGQRTGD